MSGKQCRPWSDATFCGIWSGSTVCPSVPISRENIGHAMRKPAFRHMWTAKAQISLHIRAAWSGTSLSANSIIGYYRMYDWRAKTWMILCAYTGWSDSVLSPRLKALFCLTRHGTYLELSNGTSTSWICSGNLFHSFLLEDSAVGESVIL